METIQNVFSTLEDFYTVVYSDHLSVLIIPLSILVVSLVLTYKDFKKYRFTTTCLLSIPPLISLILVLVNLLFIKFFIAFGVTALIWFIFSSLMMIFNIRAK